MFSTLLLSNSLDLLLSRLKENVQSNALLVVSDIHSQTALLVELQSFGMRHATIDERQIAPVVHIFAGAAIDTTHLDYYLSQDIELYIYALSPCMHFWSDVCSDKEAKKLMHSLSDKHRKAVSDYLYDRSKLLANNGGPIRDTSSFLIDRVGDIREEYVLKEWMRDAPYVRQDVVRAFVQSPPSLFDMLQGDLLLLGKAQKAENQDPSVAIHAAPTLQREVELLYQYIQQVSSARIVVFAPDIERYRPYIQSLFPHSSEIVGRYQYEILPVFIDLLNGKTGSLFKNRSFQKKWGLDPDDLSLTAHLKHNVVASWISEELISVQDAEVLGKYLQALQGLKREPENKWQRHFMQILDGYFADDTDEFYLIKRAIMKAYQNDAEMTLEEAIESFKAQIEEVACQALAPLVFTSLGSCRTLPREVVCFLGMNEGAIDRASCYLVLEAIVAATNMLYISYQSFSFQERCYLKPHVVVQDIMDAVGLEPSFIKTHPLASISDEPYTGQQVEQQAASLYVAEVPEIIHLKELAQAAKYPLRAYYQQGYKLYLNDQNPYESDFDLQNVHLLKQKLFSLAEVDAKRALDEHLVRLPAGLKMAASMLFEEEKEALDENAKALQIVPEEPLDVELTTSVKRLEQTGPRSWKHPAIELEVEGKKLLLAGHIPNLYPQGVVLFERKTKESFCKIWPQLLLATILQDTLAITPDILFVKEAKKESIAIEDPKTKLGAYVAYVLKARASASLLYPDLFSTLKKEKTAPKMAADTIKDPYFELHLSRTAPDVLQQEWQAARDSLQHLFGEVYEF